MNQFKAEKPDVIVIRHINIAPPHGAVPALREQLISGRGLKAVGQHGWQVCREELLRASFSEIFRTQVREITALRQLCLQTDADEQVDMKAAEVKADRIGAGLQAMYPFESTIPFYGFAEENKYWLIGRRHGKDYPLTRIYIGQHVNSAVDNFVRLIRELESRGCLPYMDIALNREIFFPGGNPLENNGIIIYVMSSEREMLRNICQAIEAARVDSALTAAERAQLKENNIRDFLVPLADNVAFVEMNGNVSYHTTVCVDLFRAMFGRPPYFNKLNLAEIQQELDRWTPDNPGFFEGKPQQVVVCGGKPLLYPPNPLANRRKYMPALVFDQ